MSILDTRLYAKLQKHRGKKKLKFIVATDDEALEFYLAMLGRKTVSTDGAPAPASCPLKLYGTEIRHADGNTFTFGDVRELNGGSPDGVDK